MKDDMLRKLQCVQIEILDEIVRICERRNLTYYLIGGTLLGATRHRGFIPWDDDLDIAMPRDDYNKFVMACKEELKEDFFLQNTATDKSYFFPHAKVRKNNTLFIEPYNEHLKMHRGIFVDIFILDGARDPDHIQEKIRYSCFKTIDSLIRLKCSRKISGWKRKVLSVLVKPINLVCLYQIRERVMVANNNVGEHYVNLASQYGPKKQTIPKGRYFPPTKIEFEGKLYSAPNDSDYLLARIYGNYMELPPVEKRVNHSPIRIEIGDQNGDNVSVRDTRSDG